MFSPLLIRPSTSSTHRALCAVLLPLALLTSFAATAAQGTSVDVAPTGRDARELREAPRTEEADPDFGDRLDRWHDWLYLKVQNGVERTDARFARDESQMLPVPATPFRIGFEAELTNRDSGVKPDASLDVDIILKLPNLEDRFRIFVTSDDVAETPTLVSGNQGKLRAGVRFNPLSFLDFDVGVRADVPPYAFTSLRWQRIYEAGGWDFQPFAKLYLETRDGFGFASGVTFDKWMNRLLVRSSTYANWRRDESATEWTQTLMVANAREIIRFGRYGAIVRGRDLARGYGAQLLASGEHTSRTDLYEASVFLKQATRKRWLYWTVTPFVRQERKYGWHTDPGIRVGFDALFWDLSTR